MAGVEADELSEPLRERVERTSLGGLETARLLAIREGTALFVHWIAFEGRVYRVASICPLGSFDQQRTRLLAIANSFGPIPAEELDALREQRLALVAAEPGESLAALLARSGSSWAPATAAIANGLPMASTPLAEGFVVKVARERPFRVAGATSSSDSARTSAAPSAGVIW
jgi:predicted Zn-dependent protease